MAEPNLVPPSWKPASHSLARRGDGINVCLVSQEYPPETAWGGIGTQTWIKANALARLGHTVHVLTCSAGAEPKIQREYGGRLKVHRIQPPGVEFPVYSRQTYMLGYTWHVLRYLTWLRDRVDFDVIDFPEFAGEGFAYLMDRTSWNWLPVVVHLHGPLAMFAQYMGWPKDGGRFHQFGTLLEKMSIQLADALMAGSRAIADLVSLHYNVARDAIHVVHCGVDASFFRPCSERKRENSRPTVLFVGQLTESKGLEATFEAVLRLRSKYPAIHLQILGGIPQSDLMRTMRERIESEKAEANVEFVGFLLPDALRPYYQRADVFCAPAWFEGGTASVYLEAMACGCPVVASTAGGAPEAITNGETGLLVPPNDVAATMGALDRILSDEPNRRRMGEAARCRIEEYFTMEHLGRRVLTVYEQAIARANESAERFVDNRE